MYNVTLRRVRAIIFAVEKQWVLLNLSVFVFIDLSIQHAIRMRHIVICGLSRSTIFFHISPKLRDFRKKKKLLNTKCVF